MASASPEYLPVSGKTYTLFGGSGSTVDYFATIRRLADQAMALAPDLSGLIQILQRGSANKRWLRKISRRGDEESRGPGPYGDSQRPAATGEGHADDALAAALLQLVGPALSLYTEQTAEHLRSLSLRKIWDRGLHTSREQYHLYMLEIELTNRLYIRDYLQAQVRIALLPYCLQDFSVKCQSQRNGFDYRCRHCSAQCFQNRASQLLARHGIEPYIWMEGDLEKLAKQVLRAKQSLGVLGIACIPELTRGMRRCRKNRIPAIGLPLNANRCRRWFGEFFPNSIDLAELERLLSGAAGA